MRRRLGFVGCTMQAVDGSARRSPWRVVDVGGNLKSGM
ncbi:conserved hypothetical protein [Burkholderia mallei PRL-20]|uniref:Uncharacterized protein n=1 Tax=Burkholderia mallei (strain NCTC 10229) TaxID=412022 RepID=A2S0S1_BURM9|nr:hypothetical protein BMASAVP1_1555 [Burkholderia mallei SAVP1]ABM99020.2 hypothetical protein BMA10229_1742 [Burkholderia mallei NCTC 10229]ABO03197.1 hypothetical protein BMA10247_A0405 [Burkholderia mallei NCTC 10247]EDK86520.1 hypothetical protein BMA721280_I0257 [Burkholderia mallei 2002721280]EDP88246.1 hypothetical protein BMA10399_K0230 [Burkholderia mallei ATCC 10399]EES42472.1 conserved hypothetical protein [Burkholderia mallei PRL-20]